jgi:hypothetical protein
MKSFLIAKTNISLGQVFEKFDEYMNKLLVSEQFGNYQFYEQKLKNKIYVSNSSVEFKNVSQTK